MSIAIPRWAHRDARGACEHRAAASGAYWRAFHPGQRTFDYLCQACASGATGGEPAGGLVAASPDLVERLEREGVWEGATEIARLKGGTEA
ncbi:hypothetical protein ABZ135_33735 [Streptomyces sp. NPDC006339]|uniref:hypothetical protein n=1 Tax=Streptomyces sp. NPDC006339 TaxID=3156755 RepID=UPI00339FB41C